MSSAKNTLFIGTRKGLVIYEKRSSGWEYAGENFDGIPVSYATADPDHKTWWACQDHGHWGCKLHLSRDQGTSWEEVDAPKYAEDDEIKEGVPATLKYLWVLQPHINGDSNHILIGTEPGGLFESKNAGKNFELVRGLWDHPTRKEQWFGGGRDYAGIHSIVIDKDNHDHRYVGISCAGVFETWDGGRQWEPKNKGLRADFLPDPSSEVGQDPHLLVAHPVNQKVMWQQNHCGIFRSIDGANQWQDISEPNGMANFGFVITLDEKDEDTAWVVPAVSDEKRLAIDRALVVCRTRDGGKSWEKLTNGLPQKACYDIVYRHGMDITGDTLAFGTTNGNLYLSENQGDDWESLNHNLPMIYAVRFV